MNGWSLDQVRDLEVTDYDEIVLWLKDQASEASGDKSIDMDAVVRAQLEAQKKKQQQEDAE